MTLKFQVGNWRYKTQECFFFHFFELMALMIIETGQRLCLSACTPAGRLVPGPQPSAGTVGSPGIS